MVHKATLRVNNSQQEKVITINNDKNINKKNKNINNKVQNQKQTKT